MRKPGRDDPDPISRARRAVGRAAPRRCCAWPRPGRAGFRSRPARRRRLIAGTVRRSPRRSGLGVDLEPWMHLSRTGLRAGAGAAAARLDADAFPEVLPLPGRLRRHVGRHREPRSAPTRGRSTRPPSGRRGPRVLELGLDPGGLRRDADLRERPATRGWAGATPTCPGAGSWQRVSAAGRLRPEAARRARRPRHDRRAPGRLLVGRGALRRGADPGGEARAGAADAPRPVPGPRPPRPAGAAVRVTAPGPHGCLWIGSTQ